MKTIARSMLLAGTLGVGILGFGAAPRTPRDSGSAMPARGRRSDSAPADMVTAAMVTPDLSSAAMASWGRRWSSARWWCRSP